ncbi:penicillin-binding protein 2 [Thermoleophilia bacterium SCSIO 60948]|nr:penicillin-binding protein 2 [Thermoleophilia bacterium SCSIO 60948]
MKLIERRVGLLFASFCLLFALILLRAAWIQGVQGDSLSASAQSQQTQEIVVPGTRGAILDRDGTELAVSQDAVSVYATPYQVKDPARVATKLSPILDVPRDELLEAMSDRQSGFAYLARKVDLDAAAELDELGLAGIGTLPDSKRIYPQGDLAAQLIGGVGIDNDGLVGLEATEEDLLKGDDGERAITTDALGDELERDTIDPESVGEDLKLTIDAPIQAKTEEVLAGIQEKYSPKGATAIVMNPQTGEILAMASTPTFDPAEIDRATPEELRNMATGFVYEPGSTFKAFTVAGALEDDVVTPNTEFTLPPFIQVADRKIGESHPRGTIVATTADILAQSSNVGAVMIGLALNKAGGDERFDYWIHRFGFGKPTGLGFTGEEMGLMTDPEDYSGSTMGNLPIGQGLSVTPIQMAQAYAAIANGGILRTPRLLLSRGGEHVDPAEGTRVISEDNALELRKMLEGVLGAGGTASEVNVPGYELAGKTGTAEKVIDGEYSTTKYVASFVGFAPAINPKLLGVVVVDEPEGDYYGGSVAAPGFEEIAQFALPTMGIAPE